MDTTDGDLVYLTNLAAKYGKKTGRDWIAYLAITLMLGGAAFFSTVNAISLQISKYKLETTLSQCSKQADEPATIAGLPSPYQNVSHDFSKPLPSLNVYYSDEAAGTCNYLEIPPTIGAGTTCKTSSPQANTVTFANIKYQI